MVGLGVVVGMFAAMPACGLDAVGFLESDADAPIGEGGTTDVVLPDRDGAGGADGGADADAISDAGVDAPVIRPDAGVVFAPTHIQPVYSLTAPNVTIATDSVVDTTARTITVGAAAPAPLTNLIHSETFAVWSVGSFVLDPNVTLTLTGTRPLVIVAASTVEVRGHIAAYGDVATPGAGGLAAAAGPGAGGTGAKASATDISGGGGAGHATIGGLGGKINAGVAGAAGAIANANGATLVGGSGGGHGGGFTAAVCSDATRGRGGVGGGAIQISAVGKLLVASTGSVDVGGGGGSGGCKDNGADDYRGGGGGGAGGLVFFESVAGVEVLAGAELAAAGGAGGEGGDSNKMGADGQAGPYPSATALGGNANSGGKGGNGGTGAGATIAPPGPGLGGSTAGGGGGSVGRVFLGARAPALVVVGGKVSALRTDFAF